MGRHSAPDDDAADVDAAAAVETTVQLAAVRAEPAGAAGAVALGAGRHSRDDQGATVDTTEVAPHDGDGDETDVLPFLEAAPGGVAERGADSGAEGAAESAAEPSKVRPRESSTHADLRLLRQNPALRARCAAGVVVPFVLYVVVLVVMGALSAFLLWVWIPTVTAGVIVGSFLDAAHRRLNRPPSS